ncbi:MAG: DNA topoisomerase IB [Bacteroidetes bacterium]|nr:DNA topoisomerase IB [Bacteroidota bacterium]
METVAEIKITGRKLKAIVNDTVKSAEIVNLKYVSDGTPGIERVKKGSGFTYLLNGAPVKDKDTLGRIRSLVIPPAWQKVWICPDPNGHLQATGIDAMGRKQYKYHSLWNTLRNQTKFYHLLDFGRALPSIRAQVAKDLSLPGLPQRKVLAAIVMLMQSTCIRIGSSMYEKLYGSYGLTTLKNKHVSIHGTEIQFSFKGKKGVYHEIKLKSRKLANIVKQCREIPGKELFQYLDDEGNRKPVESGMVNAYIKEISAGSFSAKDFRTWAGTIHALEAFRELGIAETQTQAQRNVVAALDMVAKQLGNTRTVCKKYYVHPIIPEMYVEGSLIKFFEKLEDVRDSLLSQEEEILMRLLAKNTSALIAA